MSNAPTPAVARLPVAIVGAGPIGLTTALGLASLGIDSVVFEDDTVLSLDTKAGTLLSRTLEVFRRYGVADAVLEKSLRVDEIGEIDRRTQQSTYPVLLDALSDETRYPFVVNLPQHHLEPILAGALRRTGRCALHLGHRLRDYVDHGDHVELVLDGPGGEVRQRAGFLLGCDGGRSTVRERMGVPVEGTSLPVKYALVDLAVDLDVANPRDYPYLAYFADPVEWMVLVRHPHCWRFLYPLAEGVEEPDENELQAKSLSFIGDVQGVRVLNKLSYRVHHRVASRWRSGRVVLMGDAAHLITPMWALGLNTGALDASSLPWRLAWLLRGWGDERLLDGYEREQRPLAVHGSGEMAEAARLSMSRRTDGVSALSDNNWSNAATRTMLGVRLDVHGQGRGSLVVRETRPAARDGDRLPDALVHTPAGRQERIHDLCAGRFTAFWFADARRRPPVPRTTSPALQHWLVSRYDAPHDSGLRDRSLLDPGAALRRRLGVSEPALVLVRPDEHIAHVVPVDGTPDQAERLYAAITGVAPPPAAEAAA